ncbi:unnamed protein product [Lymnaea stagnalis]|uniref:Uncharacterized protein n=1 Tax=Lymnaea stagnalis TaxID=6523 RepID=A0AAV2HWW6_LYMST
MENMVQPLTAVTLDPEQTTSFLDLVSQAYFTFVATVALKVASSGLKVDEPDDIQILYVWRSIAQLAKEGRFIIKEFLTTKPIIANYLVLKSDSTTVQRLAYTVMGPQADAAQGQEHSEEDYSSLDDPKV